MELIISNHTLVMPAPAVRMYAYLLTMIAASNDESSLRRNMNMLPAIQEQVIEHFVWGFGGSHLWVKQLDGKGGMSETLIQVNF